IGEAVEVHADVFADGHDVIAALLRDRHCDAQEAWRETPMSEIAPGSDEWAAGFRVVALGWHEYSITAWIDRFRSWRRDREIKAAAGQDVSIELVEGSMLLRDPAERADRRSKEEGAEASAIQKHAGWLLAQAEVLGGTGLIAGRVEAARSADLAALMDIYSDRPHASS